MLKLVSTIALAAAATAAHAVDYRWTDGFGQGTPEAKITSKAKDELLIDCGSGREDRPVGMYFTIGGKANARGEKTYVRFVVDGKNHPFEFVETKYDGSGRGVYGNLHGFVAALARSRAASFQFEIPEDNLSRSLSLLNAADAPGPLPDFIIGGCR